MTILIIIECTAEAFDSAVGIVRERERLTRSLGPNVGAWIAVTSFHDGQRCRPFHLSRLRDGGIKIKEVCREAD